MLSSVSEDLLVGSIRMALYTVLLNAFVFLILIAVAPGQRVVTIFGEGTIASYIKSIGKAAAKYRVKLPFGTAFVNPSAILYGVPSRDSPFVRRDGAMVRDESVVEEVTPSTQLGERYQLLFGTESIYMFMRQLALLCAVLTDTREQCAAFPPTKDPALSYCNSFRKDDDVQPAAATQVDFAAVLGSLKKVVSNQMDAKEFETLGRKVSKEKVHQMAALPKLIERCANALIKCAKEDALLHLYDYCQYDKVDPVAVQAHCFAVAPDASYRIQYDRTTGELCFSYGPKGEALLMAPGDDIKSFSEDEEMETSGENDCATSAMEDEDDPIVDPPDRTTEPLLPPWKKAKLSK
jgi:hypothetical protein